MKLLFKLSSLQYQYFQIRARNSKQEMIMFGKVVLSVNMKTKLFYIKLSKLIISTGKVAMFEFETLKTPPVDINQKI